MHLSIVDRDRSASEEVIAFAERRLRFALSRFTTKIEQVSLVMNDVNGPRGGTDKVCRVTVKLRRTSDVVLTASDADLRSCVARAADRAGRAVSRSIERSQQFDRRRPFVA